MKKKKALCCAGWRGGRGFISCDVKDDAGLAP